MDDGMCIHMMPENWCATCWLKKEKEKKNREFLTNIQAWGNNA